VILQQAFLELVWYHMVPLNLQQCLVIHTMKGLVVVQMALVTIDFMELTTGQKYHVTDTLRMSGTLLL